MDDAEEARGVRHNGLLRVCSIGVNDDRRSRDGRAGYILYRSADGSIGCGLRISTNVDAGEQNCQHGALLEYLEHRGLLKVVTATESAHKADPGFFFFYEKFLIYIKVRIPR